MQYSVRLQGQNIGKLLSFLFKDKVMEDTINEKMREFDEQMIDEKFKEFYAQINNGYEVYSS